MRKCLLLVTLFVYLNTAFVTAQTTSDREALKKNKVIEKWEFRLDKDIRHLRSITYFNDSGLVSKKVSFGESDSLFRDSTQPSFIYDLRSYDTTDYTVYKYDFLNREIESRMTIRLSRKTIEETCISEYPEPDKIVQRYKTEFKDQTISSSFRRRNNLTVYTINLNGRKNYKSRKREFEYSSWIRYRGHPFLHRQGLRNWSKGKQRTYTNLDRTEVEKSWNAFRPFARRHRRSKNRAHETYSEGLLRKIKYDDAGNGTTYIFEYKTGIKLNERK